MPATEPSPESLAALAATNIANPGSGVIVGCESHAGPAVAPPVGTATAREAVASSPRCPVTLLCEDPVHADLREVTDLSPTRYASAARQALLSYLPREDVDSARALKGYLKDPAYLHSLYQTEDGRFHYISGFAHDLGTLGRAVQLDFHSLVEGEPPDLVRGREAFHGFMNRAAQKLGGADYLFVEVTPEMESRYKQIDAGFTAFAPPGTRSAGDSYTLLALPTSPQARDRLRDQANEVFQAYVEAWCTKNLGEDWKQSQPEALPAYEEMMQAGRPVWNQPPLPD